MLSRDSRIADMSESLMQVCEKLLKADPDVVAIVQFGSSVYAPDLAQDVDILILTREVKDYGVYLDCTVGTPFQVDVVPVEIGGQKSKELAAAVRVGRLLYGDIEVMLKEVENMPVPTYDEAREEVSDADFYFQLSATEPDLRRREVHRRTSFNTLFDAARLAVMAYLNTEETRWGGLRGRLPSPFDERFREIINNCHVTIFYRRILPPVDIEAEYQRWRRTVVQFINDLEAATNT